MTDAPWAGDACSLVDAFRAGERSPAEELDATLAAIDASELNCFSHVDPEGARAAAAAADVSAPFGGVPTGIKELEAFAGWPYTEASLVFRDRVADHSTTMNRRLFGPGGAVPVGLTTASEFGGLNVSITKLNGVTHNPWGRGKTVGGSSGGSAAAVAGGLVPLATGGDGGGSIRIPAGYTGLVGMKGTYGRIPRGPGAYMRPNTVVVGCLARSVRDAARYYDVCSGYDPHDPTSLPRIEGWEAGLGSLDLRGLRVAVDPTLGGVPLEAGVGERIEELAGKLIAETGMVRVEHPIRPPNLTAQWAMGNLATLLADLGDRWPACAGDLTEEIAIGLRLAQTVYNLDVAAVAEKLRTEANEVMADAFDDVDLIIAATNPGPAFAADAATSADSGFVEWVKGSTPGQVLFRGVMGAVGVAGGAFPRLPSYLLDTVAARFPDLLNMGALTILSNLHGNPAVSLPAGLVGGLPVGLQVLARHHADQLLFDVALAVERLAPWPLVAPTA